MDIPMRDIDPNDHFNVNDVKERQIVTSLDRSDLEDRYLRLRETHAELKKKSHSQEEKMKKMATKLLRLVRDKKQLDGASVDIESHQTIEELRSNITSLEKQNNQLKSKLIVYKQLLQTQGVKNTPYDHVKAKINTGITPKKSAPSRQQRIREQMRVQGPPQQARQGSPKGSPMSILPQPRYGHSLLEEARLENRDLEVAIGNYEEQIQQYEEQVELLKMRMKQKDLDHEEDMQKIKQRVSDSQRTKLQENIELVKLQREVKDKVAQLQGLQGKYQNLEELLKKVKLSHEQVLEEMEGLTTKLKDEKDKSSRLENQIKHENSSDKILEEKDEFISDLKAEIELLKEAHQNLIHSTFDAERERKYRAKERQYQLRIAQLEATIKADVSEKNEVLDKLTSERDVSDTSRSELRELQVKYFEMKEKYEDLSEKLKFFTNESSADFEEVQEALLLVKARKEKASHDLNFLEQVDEVMNKDAVQKIQELQAAHAETINELEKTRNMLLIQHNINKDYQKEVEQTTKKMEEVKKESDVRVQEYAQLLDIRAQRIKKLESQLRDVAYGTKQYKIRNTELDAKEEEEEGDLDVELERGQNVFEIHVGKMNLTQNALDLLGNSQASLFISYEFFEYELQATPINTGKNCDFNHTSQYTVQVDDFFLHYLQKESMIIELHQAMGMEYVTLAKASLRLNDIIHRSHGRIHATVVLQSIENRKEIATVEYWLRLRVPMEQALRLYRERTKALGYLTSNDLQKLENPNQKSLKDSGINELKIGIIRCINLKSNMKDVQPHPYCVYKFFDFGDHDTEIIENSNSPQFHDYRTFPIPMTEELDSYLKSSNLQIYVFDDIDPEPASYLGLATVPLISLSQDKPLKGKFQLKNIQGQETGSIDVNLSWEYTYLPASAKSNTRVHATADPVAEELIQSQRSIGVNELTQSQRSQGVMQSIQSSGKLLEPRINIPVINDEEEEDAELLQPVHDHITIASKEAESSKQVNKLSEPEKSSMSIKKKKEKTPTNSDENIRKDEKKEKAEKEKGFDDENVKSKSKESIKSPPPEINDSALKDMDLDEIAALATREMQKKPLNEIGGTGSENESDRELENYKEIANELRRTIETPEPDDNNVGNDTMFQEEEVMSDYSDEGPSEKTKNAHEIGESSVASDETEDDVIVTSSINRSVSISASPCTITVTISSLTLFDDASILSVDTIKQLFVSYKFLDYDPEELETPISLPKPKANHPISFNFKKVFHVDAEQHGNSRQHLMHLLMPDHPSEGRIFFTVVSDPVDDEDADCDDVGIAYIDLIQILRDGRDIIDSDIDVYDLYDESAEEGSVIGSLTVSVEAVDALRSLYRDE